MTMTFLERIEEPTITSLTIRTDWGAGTTHIYAISTDEGIVLVDSGHDNDIAWQILTQGLRETERDVSEITAVLLTHSHGDHMGLAHRLKTRFGARIYVHETELEAVVDRSSQWGRTSSCMATLLREHGVPREIVEGHVHSYGNRGGSYTSAGQRQGSQTALQMPHEDDPLIRPIKDGEALSFGNVSLTAIHCPGHSPGTTVYWNAPSRTLFAGDHVLQRITPNPIIYYPDGNCERRTRSLPDYLASLGKVRSLPARRVLPGHGGEMDNLQEAVDRLFRHHARRAERVVRALNGSSKDAFEMLPALFPHLRPHQLHLGMFEVIGHLDMLVDEGRVVEEKRDGRYYYRAAKWR